MDRTFTLEEARTCLGELRDDVAELIEIRADLTTQAHAHNVGQNVAIPDIKALEARMGDILDGIRAQGVQVKGYAPVLIDFACPVGDRTVMLCWIEGEPELGWYHEAELGFMGRRPLAQLASQLPATG